MASTISSKLAALGVALALNGLMIGGIAYLFNGQLHGHAPITALAQTAVTITAGAI